MMRHRAHAQTSVKHSEESHEAAPLFAPEMAAHSPTRHISCSSHDVIIPVAVSSAR